MSLVQEMQRWRVRDGWRRASSSEESEAEPSLSLTTRSTADTPKQVTAAPSPRWYRTSTLPTSVRGVAHIKTHCVHGIQCEWELAMISD